MKRANRLNCVDFSATIELSDRVRQLRAEGHDIISMANARPDFATPEIISEAAIAALRIPHTYTTYTASRGLLELREVIANKLQAENSVTYDPDTEVLITAGEREGLFLALQAFINPGDEVLVLDPGWVTYAAAIRLAGGIPVSVPLRRVNNYHPDPQELKAAITARTKAFVFNSPNNPTGAVFTREELMAVAELAIEHDFLVITDEIYEHFIYSDAPHISIATLPGMWERTITTNSTSKGWAMTGWRIGYAAAPPDMIEAMLLIHQHLISSPCAFAQKGAVKAFTEAQENVQVMMQSYRRRRDLLHHELQQYPKIQCLLPEGACFFFPYFGEIDDVQLAYRFLEEAKLALTPGSAFGPQGKGCLRISFAGVSEDLIQEVGRRLRSVTI